MTKSLTRVSRSSSQSDEGDYYRVESMTALPPTDGEWIEAADGTAPMPKLAKVQKDPDKYEGYHPGVTCDVTDDIIVGTRYNLVGENYDLCAAEYDKLSDEEKAKYKAIEPTNFRPKTGGDEEDSDLDGDSDSEEEEEDDEGGEQDENDNKKKKKKDGSDSDSEDDDDEDFDGESGRSRGVSGMSDF